MQDWLDGKNSSYGRGGTDMKVRDLILKYRMCSNATMCLTVLPIGTTAFVRGEELRDPPKDGVFGLTLQSFDVIDNVVTIYAKGE